ncbi:MAG: prepilin-type N-terminal cleavage/methylation domain-containing protein [Geobacteraceae bacterium]|nr:prepilin-type N-terminal cleavage/methylation domain-containing protein [Geobacteraceae bacterium]
MRGNRGFTLIEVIVVAAIIAILAGILVPMIFNQIDEAKKTRALADCKTISNAVMLFRKDTGKWPYYMPGDCSFTYLAILGSGNTPANTSGDWQLGLNDVALKLILNLPSANPPIAQTCYNGKAQNYFSQDSPDPWDNAYAINAANFATTDPVWVISAGPNGVLETSAISQTLNDLLAGGDDIGIRIK